MIKKESISNDLVENQRKFVIDTYLKNDIAVVNFKNGNSAIMNLLTGTIIGDVRKYKNVTVNKFIIQVYEEIDENAINLANVKKINIYDTLEKKVLCKDFKLLVNEKDVYYFLNPYTNKYYILDNNGLSEEYDSIVVTTVTGVTMYRVFKGQEKALYTSENGFITDFSNDLSIDMNVINLKYKRDNLKVFSVNGKKGIYVFNNGFITSFSYDNIYVSETGVLVLIKGNESYLFNGALYYFNENKLMTVSSKNLKFKDDVVIWKENGIYNIRDFNGHISIELQADNIFYEKGSNFVKFERNGKFGLATLNGVVSTSDRDDIRKEGGYYFVLNENSKYDIYGGNGNIELKNCSIINSSEDIPGLYLLSNNDGYIILDIKDGNIRRFTDKPEYVGNGYFVINFVDNNRCYTKILNKTSDILIIRDSENFNFKPLLDLVTFSVNSINYLLKLEANFSKKFYDSVSDRKGFSGNYKLCEESIYSIDIYNGVYIVKGNTISIVSLKSLTTLKKRLFSSPFEVINLDDKDYFMINGECYVYDESEDSIVKSEYMPTTSYYSLYETDYGSIFVENADKSVYEYLCEFIENSDVDAILEDYYNKNKELQLIYPNLRKK